MTFVRYREAYARQIADLYYNTIHEIAAADYTPEQLAAWAPSPIDYAAWKRRLAKSCPAVAVEGDEVIGFAELRAEGYIDCFYVHARWQHKGVGTALLTRLEQLAVAAGRRRLQAAVSITARPFFLAHGFRVLRENLARRGGQTLTNILMEKTIHQP